MRHKEETQGSDKYDKKSHDRLCSAATQYVDSFARQFSASPPAPEGWSLVEGQPASFEFTKGESGFVCTIDWFDSLRADSLYRFATLPGREEGLTWKTPPAAAKATKAPEVAKAAKVVTAAPAVDDELPWD